MAYNFSANQFEDGYKARRLGNWEVPKWYPAQPRTPLTTTKFIADARGHLLPGVGKANPWGTYQGTWQLPRRITKTYAEEINAPHCYSQWGKRRAPSHIHRQVAQSEPEKLPVLHSASVESFGRRNKSSTALELRSPTPSKVEPLQPIPAQQSTPNICPGTLDNSIRDILKENEERIDTPETPLPFKPIEALQKCDTFTEENGINEDSKKPKDIGMKNKVADAIMNEYSSFQVAKRYHDENLKHQPLPDVVDDPVFKALASSKHPYPGKSLDVHPNAAAIGWKGSGGPGPTKCSKVKVYRPKTAAIKAKHVKQDSRPKTCEPQKEKRLGPIDLAICWDLAPDERPRRGQHIDGVERGEAPAVFAVVKPDDREIVVAGSAQAVATHVPITTEEDNVGTLPPKIGEKIVKAKKVINKSAIMSQVKPVENSPVISFHSLSPDSAEIARNNPKTAWTNYDTSKELSHRLQELEARSLGERKSSGGSMELPVAELHKKKMHRSTPNLTAIKKTCNGSHCGTESDKASLKKIEALIVILTKSQKTQRSTKWRLKLACRKVDTPPLNQLKL